jgi:hypothetical protein
MSTMARRQVGQSRELSRWGIREGAKIFHVRPRGTEGMIEPLQQLAADFCEAA